MYTSGCTAVHQRHNYDDIVDSDHAGEPSKRHCLRGQSTWQSAVALSSGESEFYAIVKAAAQGEQVLCYCEGSCSRSRHGSSVQRLTFAAGSAS
eukprot:1134381-Amphidinium_carterae.1